jgi:hypothetical protein
LIAGFASNDNLGFLLPGQGDNMEARSLYGGFRSVTMARETNHIRGEIRRVEFGEVNLAAPRFKNDQPFR